MTSRTEKSGTSLFISIIIVVLIIKIQRLKWHCHIKDIAGALYRIYTKRVLNAAMSDYQQFVEHGNGFRSVREWQSEQICFCLALRNCSSELAALVAGGKPVPGLSHPLEWGVSVRNSLGDVCRCLDVKQSNKMLNTVWKITKPPDNVKVFTATPGLITQMFADQSYPVIKQMMLDRVWNSRQQQCKNSELVETTF